MQIETKKSIWQNYQKLLMVFLFVMGSFLVVGKASAATWYVSTIGTDDSSHGTTTGAGAWKTLDYALTGTRISDGDTINIEAGTYDSFYGSDTRIVPSIANFSNRNTTIQAYPLGSSVTLNIPANSNAPFLYAPQDSSVTIKGIKFTNTHSIFQSFYYHANGNRKMTFQDCSFDYNSVNYMGFQIVDSVGTADYLTFNRCSFKNFLGDYILRNNKASGNPIDLTIESCTVYNYKEFLKLSQKTNLYFYNNSLSPVANSGTYQISFENTGNASDVRNNIFMGNQSGQLINFNDDAVSLDVLANPSNYILKNNIFWTNDKTANTLDKIVSTSNNHYLIPLDVSNYYINPNYNNVSSGDLSINASASCWIAGKGDDSVLPQYDINGNPWIGNDVGAYALPASVSPALNEIGSVAFSGDSIMHGSSAIINHDEVTMFTEMTGIQNIGKDSAAISSLQIGGFRHFLDYSIYTYSPSTIFVSIGVNNLADGITRYPTYVTDQQIATEIENSLQKIKNWGVQPI